MHKDYIASTILISLEYIHNFKYAVVPILVYHEYLLCLLA
jgi:hypothetical protein